MLRIHGRGSLAPAAVAVPAREVQAILALQGAVPLDAIESLVSKDELEENLSKDDEVELRDSSLTAPKILLGGCGRGPGRAVH